MPLYLLIGVFSFGYLLIIFEHYIRVSKTAVALLLAVACWLILYSTYESSIPGELPHLETHVSKAAQIIFFLIGAMTMVELIDAHKGFKIVTDIIYSPSKRKMLLTTTLLAFFLSAILDNLTTTIVMITLLRKMIPRWEDRMMPACLVVVAANAGGAWTPIGDITTTMLWIDGQISSLAVMRALFIPSVVSILIPLAFFWFTEKGRYTNIVHEKDHHREPGGKLVFYLGIGGLIFVPFFKAWTGLPPFMGMLVALVALWLATDILHYKHKERTHLRVPFILTKVDMASVLFFLGILLAMNALESAQVLERFAHMLGTAFKSDAQVAGLIGIISAIVDNVPLVAGAMGMYPLSTYPMDSPFWHMVAYAAGTGGSILIIGSASGVALMGLEKVAFFDYLKKVSGPVLIGYLAGLAAYLLI